MQNDHYQDDELFSSEGMPTIPLRKADAPLNANWVYGLLLVCIGVLVVIDVSAVYTLIVSAFAPRAWFVAGVGVVALVVAYVQHWRILFGVGLVLTQIAVALPFAESTQGAILPMALSVAVLVCFVVFRILYQQQHQWMLVVSGFALVATLLMVIAQYGIVATRFIVPGLIILIGVAFMWQLRMNRS
jgi:hypothetical protein